MICQGEAPRPESARRSSRRSSVGIVLGRDGKVELAVLQHLGPDAAVDAAAQVLDELAVDVLRDRVPFLRRVDGDRTASSPRLDSNSSCRSSNQALPVASPQPPNRQLTCTASLLPVSNTTSTRVQSRVPVTAVVATRLHVVQIQQRPAAPPSATAAARPRS